MAATQGSMADLSSANSTYLSSTEEEPELNSINFRQSLRFFQEQLINSTGFPSPSPSRSDVRKFCIDFANEHNKPLNEVPKSLSSSRISIPTVDTILESVRVLRAIQKSQQQRGSTWSLNLLQSDDDFEIPQSSIFEDLKNVEKSDSLFKNGLHYILPTSVDSEPIETIVDKFKENNVIEKEWIHSKPSELLTSYNVSRQEISKDSNTEMVSELLTNNIIQALNTSLDADVDFESTNARVSESDSEKEQQTKNEKLSKQNHTMKLPEDITTSVPELALLKTITKAAKEEKYFCKDNTKQFSNINEVHEEINEDANSEYFYVTENLTVQVDEPILKNLALDSEGNQSALNSPSAFYKHYRPESRSDTCSSIYVSAEGSPCPSLYNDVEASPQIPERIPEYVGQCVNSETKDSACDTWATESSGIGTDLTNDTRSNESTSSRSSTSIDNILDDSPIPEKIAKEECISSGAAEDLENETHSNSIPLPILNEKLTNHDLPEPDENDISNKLDDCASNGNNLNGNGTEVNEDLVEFLPDEQQIESDETIEIRDAKKFTTSSWNLEAITESLYALQEPLSSKIFPEDSVFQSTVLIMSQGAFSKYPEGIYTLVLQDHTLRIMQEENSFMTIPLTYAELYVELENILKLDNKLGKCLYFKSETQKQLMELKKELELHCSKCWKAERLNLVHYPLKCHQNVVIIDLGSCSTRAGILMDQPTLPFLFFPSICAVNKKTGDHVYGKEALQLEVRQNSNLSFPLRPSIKIIKHSIDIDLIEGLFKKIFLDLRIDPSQYAVQVCLPRSLSNSIQNALVKLLLEEIKVQSVSLTHQALLTLYAHNVSTGIVVDIGDRMDILPVVDGFIVESGVTRLPYGGQRLIHHMKHALAEKHISLSNDIDSFVVQYISENLAYVAEDYDTEMKLVMEHPDIVKKTIALESFTKDDKCLQYATLDDARFKIPEGLFKPELWGLDNPGIHKLVQKAIQATSVDVRKKIAENIYVSGGVTLIPGFVERLTKEVLNLNKPRIVPQVIASNYRYHCTYIGACQFASMEVFPKVCVTLEEYRKNQISSLKKFALCF